MEFWLGFVCFLVSGKIPRSLHYKISVIAGSLGGGAPPREIVEKQVTKKDTKDTQESKDNADSKENRDRKEKNDIDTKKNMQKFDLIRE